MGHESALARVQNREVLIQAGSNVIGCQQSRFGGFRQSLAAHELHICPRNRQHTGRAITRSRDRNAVPLLMRRFVRVARHERSQVGFRSYRPNARSTAAVRDAEGFVQVQVGHVAAELARLGQTNQRIQVGTVNVHLAAGSVDRVADLADVASYTPCVDG